MIDRDLIKHRAEFQRALTNHKYERTEEGGLLFPAAKALVRGFYVHDVNGQDERIDENLIVTEGLNHMLTVTLSTTSGYASPVWYLGLFSGDVTVLSTWTNANWVSNATEITSGTEGYSEATRPAFVEGTASAGSINNTASKAAFTIVTATSVVVRGAALSSSSAKGNTSAYPTAALFSATKFSSARTLYNSDVFNVGYTVTLTSS